MNIKYLVYSLDILSSNKFNSYAIPKPIALKFKKMIEIFNNHIIPAFLKTKSKIIGIANKPIISKLVSNIHGESIKVMA